MSCLNSCDAKKDASNSPKRTETMFRVGIYKLHWFARKEIVYGPRLRGRGAGRPEIGRNQLKKV